MKIKIPWTISDSDIENIENNLAYFDDIKSFKINKNENSLSIEAETELEQKVNDLLIKLQPMTIDEDVIDVKFSSLETSSEFKKDIYSELIKSGDLFQHGPGYYSYSGLFLKMINKLDEELQHFCQKQKAKEVNYPITTSIQDLKDSHFFDRTPQFAQFLSHIKGDPENISGLSKKLKDQEINERLFEGHLRGPSHICRSAVCLNSYPVFKNRVFSSEEYVILATVGKVFRNESKNVEGLERLYEFTVRDLIYFGRPEWIKVQLNNCLEWYKNLIKNFNLIGVIQSATDPFFADNLKSLAFFQMAEQSKYEIRLHIPFKSKEISCGSINNHGTHYSKSFNIKFDNNDYVTTACVGFGYERLIYAILSQHGMDPEKWPRPMQDFFS